MISDEGSGQFKNSEIGNLKIVHVLDAVLNSVIYNCLNICNKLSDLLS